MKRITILLLFVAATVFVHGHFVRPRPSKPYPRTGTVVAVQPPGPPRTPLPGMMGGTPHRRPPNHRPTPLPPHRRSPMLRGGERPTPLPRMKLTPPARIWRRQRPLVYQDVPTTTAPVHVVPNCTWTPVCGTDGQDYDSACLIPPSVNEACPGHCPCYVPTPAPPVQSGCGCGPMYYPICGRDGLTYDNHCQLYCAYQLVQCSGPCPCPTTPAPVLTTTTRRPAPETPPWPPILPPPVPCTCLNQPYSPVCGKDSRVYINDCERNCAGVELSCSGLCPCEAETGRLEIEGNQYRPAYTPTTLPPPTLSSFFSWFMPVWPVATPVYAPSCPHCWLDYDPVCGSDDITYMNLCQARCSDAEIRCTSECPC